MKHVLPILVAVVMYFPPFACHAGQWPEISPVAGEKLFTDPDTAEIQIDIPGPQSKAVYVLTCKSSEFGDNDFYYSGLFQCRLVPTHSRVYVMNLLIDDEDQTTDWEGRSRFLTNHVVGRCAGTPDWGAERTFLLRGMRINLAVRDVALTGSLDHRVLTSFLFVYDIAPDASATTSIARPSPIEEPAWFGAGVDCLKDAFEQK
jgi:hypothetical protein